MILDKIIEKVKIRIEEQKKHYPIDMYKQQNLLNKEPNLFKDALLQPGIQIIAEIKKASPSAGTIAKEFNPISTALDYAEANVAAISILTEEDFFHGSLNILQMVRRNVQLPLLR